MRYILIAAILLVSCNTLKQQRQELISTHTWPDREVRLIKQGVVKIGFTKEQVIAAWGRPHDVNTSVYEGYKQTQWVYRNLYAYGAQYVYFKNGRVSSMQDF